MMYFSASRGRHTSSYGDWSSDVCSSDLHLAVRVAQRGGGEVIPTTLNASALRDPDGKVIGAIGILRDMREYEQRSEERRVGKECGQRRLLWYSGKRRMAAEFLLPLGCMN